MVAAEGVAGKAGVPEVGSAREPSGAGELHALVGPVGRVVRSVESSGAFIDGVERRDVEQVGAGAIGGGELRPEVTTLEP